MSEGSLEAPIRHPIAWQDPDFYDAEKLDAELRRVFDICHGCRRCFNLCNAFPTLFDLIDEAEEAELEGVDSKDFKKVADGCTLCDMCFLTKCPYVPPHEFNLDFPHLILRYRALEHKNKQIKKCHTQLTRTDRNGKLGVRLSFVVNFVSRRKNKIMRLIMQYVMGLSAKVKLPKFAKKSLLQEFGSKAVACVGGQKKVALYVGCHCNYSDTEIGKAAIHILEKFGVHCELVYPECCGMPQVEVGNLPEAVVKAERISKALRPYVEGGYDIVALTPSCSLLMKFEWVLLLPDNEDCRILSDSVYDVSEYIVKLSKEVDSLPEAEKLLDGGVSFHMACHARAQNMGQKGVELLKLLPSAEIKIVERCSGHGGAWGVMADNFDVAVKVGRPAARAMNSDGISYITSECPLAALHLGQIIDDSRKGDDVVTPQVVPHPLILLAEAYGMER